MGPARSVESSGSGAGSQAEVTQGQVCCFLSEQGMHRGGALLSELVASTQPWDPLSCTSVGPEMAPGSTGPWLRGFGVVWWQCLALYWEQVAPGLRFLPSYKPGPSLQPLRVVTPSSFQPASPTRHGLPPACHSPFGFCLDLHTWCCSLCQSRSLAPSGLCTSVPGEALLVTI